MLVLLLFAFMLLMMLMRVRQPIGVQIPGTVQKVVPLSFQEKALMQRVNVYCIGTVLVLMAITRIMPTFTEVGVVLIALLILAMSVRVICTTEGIAINNVVFRPWSDFTAFRVEHRRIVLIAKPGNRPLYLYVIASHQQEIIPFLRRRLPEAKAGKAKDSGEGDRGLALARK